MVEAFPSSFLGVMIDDPKALNARRGDGLDTFFQHLAGELAFCTGSWSTACRGCSLVSHPSGVTNHDDRAAFDCALSRRSAWPWRTTQPLGTRMAGLSCTCRATVIVGAEIEPPVAPTAQEVPAPMMKCREGL